MALDTHNALGYKKKKCMTILSSYLRRKYSPFKFSTLDYVVAQEIQTLLEKA